jgi:hypothetical protein
MAKYFRLITLKSQRVGKRAGKTDSQAPGREIAIHASIPNASRRKAVIMPKREDKNQKNKSRKVLLARFFFGLAPATGLALCMVIQNL